MIKKNHALRALNSFQIQAHAKRYVSIKNIQQLKALIDEDIFSAEKCLVLGSGSNVLFTKDYPGWVLHNEIEGIEVIRENTESIWLRSGGGHNWHDLVKYCVNRGYHGIENLSLIPGTAGAAPIQNIGAYGVEIREVFDSLNAINLQNGQARTFTKNDCKFSYRDSIFKQALKHQYCITDITLRLNKKPTFNLSYPALQHYLTKHNIEINLANISKAICEIRRSKLPDPATTPNAGSFFKNPIISTEQFQEIKSSHPNLPHYPLDNSNIKIPAAWLIEQCGFKGERYETAEVHNKQALVLINRHGSSATPIIKLAERIHNAINTRFDIKLETEVNII